MPGLTAFNATHEAERRQQLEVMRHTSTFMSFIVCQVKASPCFILYGCVSAVRVQCTFCATGRQQSQQFCVSVIVYDSSTSCARVEERL